MAGAARHEFGAEVREGQGLGRAPRAYGVHEDVGQPISRHPPIRPYRVDVSDASHPLVEGIEPFDADDELYLSEYHGSNHALLHTRFSGEAPGFTAKHWPAARRNPGLRTAARIANCALPA